MLGEIERIAKMMTHIELSDNPSFMDKYMGALFLPHTEDSFFGDVINFLETNCQMIRNQRKTA
jgi:hypothetical protein